MNQNKLKIFIITVLTSIGFGYCQENENLTYNGLKLELAKFLIENNSLEDLSYFKENPSIIDLSGVHNDYKKENLIDGIYSFSINRTHHSAYFVIVDNNSFIILDISNKEGLMKAINDTLDFAEKNKYCEKIIKDYINRLLGVYYNINKNPNNRGDINCKSGVKSTDDLP